MHNQIETDDAGKWQPSTPILYGAYIHTYIHTYTERSSYVLSENYKEKRSIFTVGGLGISNDCMWHGYILGEERRAPK